jgi:hypothetical protein
MTYAAYLRIYQPVAAFQEPDRSGWAAYAASSARPRRRDSLAAEQAEALHRAIAAAEIVLPDRESEHAYVRHADGVTYVCPWQTRLRSRCTSARRTGGAGSRNTRWRTDRGTAPAEAWSRPGGCVPGAISESDAIRR